MIFTLENLALAYRRAKVDMYYSTNPNLTAIANYEENLETNLTSLLERFLSKDEDWVTNKEFHGGWILTTKKIDVPQIPYQGLIFSSPDEEWQHIYESIKLDPKIKKPEAEFRLMADATMDFHILSSLWMMEVGHLYDQKLGEAAAGNRLRRKADDNINKLSLGSFVPYLSPFRRWRDKGIETMRAALDSGKKVVALTADVSSFYHELNPSFMLAPQFQYAIEFDLTLEQEKLHRLFINSLIAWAAATPLKKGLPVGLPASAVVANIALFELDRSIKAEVMPLYYGRYVDDIILVMENGAEFKNSKSVWNWLFARIPNLSWADETEETIKFSPSYLEGSKIRFGNDKTKVFLLAGEAGGILVDSILHQIRERASEWRALPNLPLNAKHVGTDLVKATQNDGETVDNLRKTDSLTMRRSCFAIKLRDFEAYERDLAPQAWREHRHAFLRAFTQHVVVLPQFFALSTYLPRVIKLATSCEDFGFVVKIIERLKKLNSELATCCTVKIKSCGSQDMPTEDVVLGRWRGNLYRAVEENIISAFPPELTSIGRTLWDECGPRIAALLDSTSIITPNIHKAHARLFAYDLAHMPFRFIGLPREMVFQRGIPKKEAIEPFVTASSTLPTPIVEGASKLAAIAKISSKKHHGLLFPVRPFSLSELCVLMDEPFAESRLSDLKAMILAARGFSLSEKMPKLDKDRVLQIPDNNATMKFGIAVSSWSTRNDSWIAAVMKSGDPDVERYARLSDLVNSVISSNSRARYFILPELAMPARWFMRVSQKLRRSNISFITGVEYLHASKSRVRNQIWASFSHDGLGFPSTMIYRQDKQKPALHEEQELRRLNGLEMRPHKQWSTPPIVQHGNFRFAMVVCSELTNITYRTALRGKVDALFVPEWNQDTDTFNALVESAALDVHAYIVQCNDRRYGDSRIRAPYKESWRRDILRVKGGTADYWDLSEILCAGPEFVVR